MRRTETGATALDIQKQIGHKSITTTFNIYGHLFRDRNEELARGSTISMEPARVH